MNCTTEKVYNLLFILLEENVPPSDQSKQTNKPKQMFGKILRVSLKEGLFCVKNLTIGSKITLRIKEKENKIFN